MGSAREWNMFNTKHSRKVPSVGAATIPVDEANNRIAPKGIITHIGIKHILKLASYDWLRKATSSTYAL